jgi:hypothetical protein
MKTNDPEYAVFLSQLAEGHEVCSDRHRTWGHCPIQIGRVTKAMKAQVIVEFERNGHKWAERYLRKSGRALVGNAAHLRPATQADRDEIERYELCEWVRDLAHAIEGGKKYPLANLRALRYAFEHPPKTKPMQHGCDDQEICGSDCDTCRAAKLTAGASSMQGESSTSPGEEQP